MYSPAQVCAAAGGIKPTTLRAWHNIDGLTVGRHQENGHRGYSEVDVALVMWIARQTGADGAGLGYMNHAAAVKIANKLLEPLGAIWAGYRAGHATEVFQAMDAAAPMAFATPSAGGWDVEIFPTIGAWAGALIERRNRVRPPILIDLSTIMKRAAAAGSRMPDASASKETAR